MRALLIGQELATAASVNTILKRENIICDTTDLRTTGVKINKLHDYDFILLDLGDRNINGYEVLRRLRSAGLRTPILILSHRAEHDQRIKDLGLGANEFLTKPFDRSELIARIQAIASRSKNHTDATI